MNKTTYFLFPFSILFEFASETKKTRFCTLCVVFFSSWHQLRIVLTGTPDWNKIEWQSLQPPWSSINVNHNFVQNAGTSLRFHFSVLFNCMMMWCFADSINCRNNHENINFIIAHMATMHNNTISIGSAVDCFWVYSFLSTMFWIFSCSGTTSVWKRARGEVVKWQGKRSKRNRGERERNWLKFLVYFCLIHTIAGAEGNLN